MRIEDEKEREWDERRLSRNFVSCASCNSIKDNKLVFKMLSNKVTIGNIRFLYLLQIYFFNIIYPHFLNNHII